ncbi:GH39 family glycosyl hydrolase [Hymenobacter sp.]|jgi:xylan 1,4-beta-xylosidase|uniref:GH39 family glycosyl hydrolase n=1 Tax=Hymenobacter sp. TaxID=1898978 RepID=UPI002ED92642
MHRAIVLLLVFSGLVSSANVQATAPVADTTRVISVDFKKTKGSRNKGYQKVIGAGRAAEGLRADWQEQLLYVKKEVGFEYIRFHGLLHDDMHVYAEDAGGKPIYNWQYVDRLYDYLVKIGVRPFVEFGFMPPALASGTQTVFWWKANVTPPKSQEKWGALVTELVKHWEARYGKKEVEKWYFEVWNEPNLKQFFAGDLDNNARRDEYFKLYLTTVNAVKSVSPTYRVGGPATSSSTWMAETLQFFTDKKAPVDFISTHAYSTYTAFDEFGKGHPRMREPDGISHAMERLHRTIAPTPYNKLEVHITEWNSSSSPRDPIHDTYMNATLVLNALKKSEHLVSSMSYWTFTDIFEEAGPPETPFHGGFGLLNLQGINKPTFYAYQYLNQLGDTEIANTDSSSWVTKDSKGNLQALFWNYTLLDPAGKLSNQEYYSQLHPAKDKGLLKLNVANVPNGKYKMQVWLTGYQKNDAFTAYKNMGAPYNLSLQQEAELKKGSSNKMESEKTITVKNGTVAEQFKLRENDMYLVKLMRQ